MAGFDTSKIKAALNRISDEFEGKVVKAGFGVLGDPSYEDGMAVAAVAAIHEYGAPAANIPPRPFMRPAEEANKDKWRKTLADGVKAVARGQATGDAVLNGIGMQMAPDIQAAINAVNSPPLKPATLQSRKRRGRGTKVLQDSGLLIASPQYIVTSQT